MCIKTIPNLPSSFCPPSIDITMGFIYITCWHLDSAHYISGSQNLNLSSVIVKGTIEIHVWIKARRGSQHPTTITIIWKLALVSLHAVPKETLLRCYHICPCWLLLGVIPAVQSHHYTWEWTLGVALLPFQLHSFHTIILLMEICKSPIRVVMELGTRLRVLSLINKIN